MNTLWDQGKADDLLAAAIEAVKVAAADTVHRDVIRTSGFTDKVMKACDITKPGA
jgi:hypothetical protein